MFANELHDFYKTWSNMIRELDLGLSSPRYWRQKGYIPYKTQLLIEKRSGGRFIADEKHAKPKQW
jgi:hypothetical protein